MTTERLIAFHATTSSAAIELTANWKTLDAKLAPAECADFMWMFHKKGVGTTTHSETRMCLPFGADSQCLLRTGSGIKEAAFEQEWGRVSGRNRGEENYGDE